MKKSSPYLGEDFVNDRGEPSCRQRCQDAQEEISRSCQNKTVKDHHAPGNGGAEYVIADKVVIQITGQIHDHKACHGDGQVGKDVSGMKNLRQPAYHGRCEQKAQQKAEGGPQQIGGAASGGEDGNAAKSDEEVAEAVQGS